MHIAAFQVLRPIHARAAERLGRRYIIAFEATTLVVLRSGQERAASFHSEKFPSHPDLIVNVTEKIRRRFSNGYVLIWWSEGFPLIEWIQERGYAVECREFYPPGIQLELPMLSRETPD